MGSYCLMSTESVLQDEKLMATDGGNGCTIRKIYLTL